MEFQFSSDGCTGGDNRVDKLEHVVLTVSFIHRRRGDLSLLLISPSGTKSELLSTRRYDDSKEGLDDWKFMTVHFWGEILKKHYLLWIASSVLNCFPAQLKTPQTCCNVSTTMSISSRCKKSVKQICYHLQIQRIETICSKPVDNQLAILQLCNPLVFIKQ